jgi:hypothetical protein
MMLSTQVEFNEAAIQLDSACSKLAISSVQADMNHASNNDSSFMGESCTKWTVGRSDRHSDREEILYLCHAPILRHGCDASPNHHGDKTEISPDDDSSVMDDDYDSLVDRGMEMEADDMCLAPNNAVASEEESNNNKYEQGSSSQNNCRRMSSIICEWHLNIVFSPTWCVPVLYVSVNYIDGTPLTRDSVLQYFDTTTRQGQGQGKSTDAELESSSWEFISEDEHPVTGVPCFFLHPCRTRERINCLHSSSPPFVPSSDYSASPSASLLLLSWMTMILPPIGIHISPANYNAIQKLACSR